MRRAGDLPGSGGHDQKRQVTCFRQGLKKAGHSAPPSPPGFLHGCSPPPLREGAIAIQQRTSRLRSVPLVVALSAARSRESRYETVRLPGNIYTKPLTRAA